jgi:hypothetical protein
VNPDFEPIASGGDGATEQYCQYLRGGLMRVLTLTAMIGYVGYDPTLKTIIVAHQGTDPAKM